MKPQTSTAVATARQACSRGVTYSRGTSQGQAVVSGCEVFRPRTPSPAPGIPYLGGSGLARSGRWHVYAMRKSLHCALEHRIEIFLHRVLDTRRYRRHALVSEGRTGPTAGETGPRCGRTCGATRRQHNDDSLLISRHALKKGGPSPK